MTATPEPDYARMSGDELRARYTNAGDRRARMELDRRRRAEIFAERAAEADHCVIDRRTGEVIEVRPTRAVRSPAAAATNRTATRTSSPRTVRRQRSGFDWQAAAANDKGD